MKYKISVTKDWEYQLIWWDWFQRNKYVVLEMRDVVDFLKKVYHKDSDTIILDETRMDAYDKIALRNNFKVKGYETIDKKIK